MKGNIDDEYQYAVVQFLELPRSNIDDYVCVPHSWIRKHIANNRIATVAFPDEPWLLTKKRIEKGEKPLVTWNVFKAIIKYETRSYNNANSYVLIQKSVAFTRNKHSDHTSLSDTATNDVSFSVKRIKLSKPQSKTNEKVSQVISKAKIIDQFPKTSLSPRYAKLESETPLNHVPKKMNQTQVSSFRTGTQGPKRNICYASQKLLISKNKILRSYPESDEKFPYLFYDSSQNKDLVEKNQGRNILNQHERISVPQHRVQDLKASTPSIIQNQTNGSNAPHQILKSPVSQDHQQALPTQTTPGRISEMKSTRQIPHCFNLAERQDWRTQAMSVDEPTEANCNARAVQSAGRADHESFASVNSRENVGQSCQSVVMEKENTTTDQVSSIEETDTEDLLSDGNVTEKTDQKAHSVTNIRDRWRHQIADIFAEINRGFSHASEVTSELHQLFVQLATVSKGIRNMYKSFQNGRVKEVCEMTPKDVTVGDDGATVEDKNKGNLAEKKKKRSDKNTNEDDGKNRNEKAKNSEDNNDDDEDDDNDDDKGSDNIEDDEEKEAPKKIRGHIRTFVLPAEYDPNDTKWTLKYRECKPKLGLVELLPGTKVYINSIRLSHCKRVAKDSKTLARMLLVEIFSQTALSVCSLTGARANAFDISGTNVRPGLDEHARMVILNFVEEHARQKNWGVFDSQGVINSIRSKIQEMRAKYGQTE